MKLDWPVIEDPVICIPGAISIGCSCWTSKGALSFIREAPNGVYNVEEIVNTYKNSLETKGFYLNAAPTILSLPAYVKILSYGRHLYYRTGDSWLFITLGDLNPETFYKPTLSHFKDLSWFLPEGYSCLVQTRIISEFFLWDMQWQIPNPLSQLEVHTFIDPLSHLLLLLDTPE